MRIAILLAALGLAACAAQYPPPDLALTDQQLSANRITVPAGWKLHHQADGNGVLVRADKGERADIFVTLTGDDGGAGFPVNLPLGERITLPRKSPSDIGYTFEAKRIDGDRIALEAALSQPVQTGLGETYAGMSVLKRLRPGEIASATTPEGGRLTIGGTRLVHVEFTFLGFHASGE